MLIELNKFNVEVKDELTFGDMEDVQEVIGNDGKDVMKGNAKLTEISIISIKDKGGAEVKYSEEWRRNLSIADGLKLSSEVQKLISGIENLVKKD